MSDDVPPVPMESDPSWMETAEDGGWRELAAIAVLALALVFSVTAAGYGAIWLAYRVPGWAWWPLGVLGAVIVARVVAWAVRYAWENFR